MPDGTTSRDRLTELIELARTYRGWTRRKLAKSLGRDASKLVPESGLPKIDLVIELARVLDWPVQDVVNSLGEDLDEAEADVNSTDSFEALNTASYEAYSEGRYVDMVALGKRAYRAAKTPSDRARACNREAGGWDGQGQYRLALEALHLGLREVDAKQELNLLLRSSLASCYYHLWRLVEAKGVATDVLHEVRDEKADVALRVAAGQSLYVRGNCLRREIRLTDARAQMIATRAKEDLVEAARIYTELARDLSNPAYDGVANTCKGAVLEIDVALGLESAEHAVEQIVAALDRFEEGEAKGEWLESYSWWCIFGCNIVLRHFDDVSTIQRCMAVLTGKATDLAETLGNWALRERALTMDFVRRQRLHEWIGTPPEWTIDSDDVRLITGAMGRFPVFRETGWQILREAQRVVTRQRK